MGVLFRNQWLPKYLCQFCISSEEPDSYFDQVLVLLRVPLQAQAPQQILLPSLDQLVKNVKVPLPMVLVDNAGLLQQVVDDVATNGGTLPTG